MIFLLKVFHLLTLNFGKAPFIFKVMLFKSVAAH